MNVEKMSTKELKNSYAVIIDELYYRGIRPNRYSVVIKGRKLK